MVSGAKLDGAGPSALERDSTTGGRRTQQLVTSVVALYGRSRPLTVATLLRLLGVLGIDDAAARTALSRLKRRHVLVSSRVDSSPVYALNPDLEETFREGDERIFSPRRAGPKDDWVLVTFSVPESQRNLRYRIRKILSQHGFGRVSSALAIAPFLRYDAVRRDLEREDFLGFVEFFSAQSLTLDHLAAKVAEWWDLEDLAARYREFRDVFAPALERWESTPEADRACAGAFAEYVNVVTVWRRLPYVDPGLAPEYLPESWPGLEAEKLFLRLHEMLAEPVRDFVRSVAEGQPAQ